MRIFHVITLSSVGGAQSVVVNLANAQVENNEVFVISSDSKEAWKALKPEVKVIGIKQLRRVISLLDIIVFFKLIYYRIKFQPDVIHLHSSKMGALGRIAFSSRKTVYTVHGFDSICVANRSFLPVEKLLKNRCAKIVGVSLYDENILKKEGIARNVTYVYNGIADMSSSDLVKIDPLVEKCLKNIKSHYGKVIMCIARDDKPKKIDLFIETAKLLPQYAFVWIGNSHEHDKNDNVFLLGQISLAYQLLKFADVFVLLSNYEGLPMSIIEAMSFGKPVVASNVGGIAELLDGTNGYAVNNDAGEVSEKIEFILENPLQYTSLSQSARETYLEKFTVGHMLTGYDKIYNEILKL